MQKDYMGMMQGQQAAPAQQQKISQEEFDALQENYEPMSDEDFKSIGMTPGNTPEAVKARISELLERMGFLEGMTPVEKQELSRQIDLFVQALISQDMEAAEKNPVGQMLNQYDSVYQDVSEADSKLQGVLPEQEGMMQNGQ